MDKFTINEIERNLGVTFNNHVLIKTALTHSSFGNQFQDAKYNERLEFLGDAVLQLCITEYLFNHYKEKSEGELTKLRSLIVCENSLYEIAKKLHLGEYIRMSKGEELTGGRERVSIQADAMEAVIAAVYLDKGMAFASDFILLHFKEIIKKAVNNEIVLDFKTKLQELMQKKGEVSIEYTVTKFEGPPHRRKFYTEVSIDKKPISDGSGYSKKEAEQNAAKLALKKLEGK